MSDLLNPLELAPILIVLAEVATMVILARRSVRRRLQLVLGTYLAIVAAAVTFAFIVRDEFGFSFIPALVLTGPWQWLLPRSILNSLPPSSGGSHYGIFLLGAGLNCAAFVLIDRLSYPKHSTKLSGRHAT